ncbi:DoxX family protein [Balneola vulgaris]|uniref:DoxX family protein n=1 Tax=Balneola vulgaris TaxID=287535 RepID=UPI0003736AF7|nr:DoxX family protein [Balneola vulgaris]
MMNTLLTPASQSILIGCIFIAIGIYHFINPDFFIRIMPEYIPNHKAMVFWSGVFEILGGLGVLMPFTREFAGWGLILLLVAVFPANIEMFIKGYQKDPFSLYTVLTFLRLPLQFVLMYWIYWAAIK